MTFPQIPDLAAHTEAAHKATRRPPENRMTTAPVDAAVTRPPIDLEVLAVVLTGELRRLRHGAGVVVCWGCPRDAAVLVARVDRAFVAGLL